MEIRNVTIRELEMTMKQPFATSFGSMQARHFTIVEVTDEHGNRGYGEGVAFPAPFYTEETTQTSIHVMRDFLIPLLKGKRISHPDEIRDLFMPIRKNNMAKAAIECAVWDCYAKREDVSLSAALGGTKKKIGTGISIGLQPTASELNERIAASLAAGYERIKVKVKPGRDIGLLAEIREAFPDIPLMADANSAYSLDDLDLLKEFDRFSLLMIEQPLGADDIVDHAVLQKELDTPICLDESILSADDARKAIGLGSCRVVNIKIGRVGGLTEAREIHDVCQAARIPVWCGGMLEAGVGRAHNIALTSLPNFTLPGDTAGSSNYWHHDIIIPEVTVDHGEITVPEGPGIGCEIDWPEVERRTIRVTELNL
ncbi:o-succinylbenzoate synthase [Sporosarcina sp. NCCP-2716]|uniref:o-succinylbenzoate synthase n=1 Tax=Sporosarcina sp. NCCP-2716 TaxID=2943679 RepID=UPI00203C5A7D|nr:o-succinylbenzoate synthase [Sporosarcina sp. NCCP-2716]GKV67892.1 o-succinylbenzoate synthase [Sporosarcina sp. NCCP-2716]